MSFGNLYKIPFTATLTTNPCDVIGITAPNNSQVVLREFIVGAVLTAQPLGATLQISIFRGSTASSTSASFTPVQILPQTHRHHWRQGHRSPDLHQVWCRRRRQR
jgi:hypothetical protein